MKQRLLLLILLVSGWLGAAAQCHVGRFEFEASVGFTQPIGRFVSDSWRLVHAFALEARFNLPRQPLDFGFEYYFGKTPRQHEGLEWKARVMGYSLFMDYNFRRGMKFAPFVGAGIGLGSCKNVNGTSVGPEGNRMLFSPRIGVEFFRHVRLTAYARFAGRSYNHLGLSLGIVLGGGRR